MDNNRDKTLDIARGFAIVLVVVGHIIQYNLIGNSSSLVFKVIYSFHMPLFFLLSGYVSTFSRKVEDIKGVWNFIYKKTLQLYIPYLIFGYAIPLACNSKRMGDLWDVISNPQNGPWFLATLWMTQLIFIIMSYTSCKLGRVCHKYNKVIEMAAYFVGLLLLLILNKMFGGSSYFTAIYYIMFIIGRYFALFNKLVYAPAATLCGLLVFVGLINPYIYPIGGGGGKYILTFVQLILSISVSIVVLYFSKSVCDKTSLVQSRLSRIGMYSLNIYLMHYVMIQFVGDENLLNVPINPVPLFFLLFIAAYMVCEIICFASILIERNKYLNFLLFGKLFWKIK